MAVPVSLNPEILASILIKGDGLQSPFSKLQCVLCFGGDEVY